MEIQRQKAGEWVPGAAGTEGGGGMGDEKVLKLTTVMAVQVLNILKTIKLHPANG